MYKFIHYHIVPPLFIVVFTGLAQILATYGREEDITLPTLLSNICGNCESWKIVCIFVLWAYGWLKIPGATTKGPPSPTGFVPLYKDNGLLYYFSSVALFLILEFTTPLHLSLKLYDLMPQLLGTANVIALLLCFYLFLGSSEEPIRDKKLPLAFIFYRGVNFHPRLLGVDVKQLTNCRFGLMAWQILVLSFYLASLERFGFSLATLTTCALQTIYLAKFFYWERGYFHTLDIILDRAGYYICWGCMVWVPCFYTFTSYYFVRHKPVMDSATAATTLTIGVISIYLNYLIDAEKQKFRVAEGQCLIWGQPAQYLTAFYTDHTGKTRKSLLLISGFWGKARHLNYTVEMVLTLCWCFPGIGLGPAPFLYFVYLVILLIHRIFRDEDKCNKKYNLFWEKYCEIVPYRLIPRIF